MRGFIGEVDKGPVLDRVFRELIAGCPILRVAKGGLMLRRSGTTSFKVSMLQSFKAENLGGSRPSLRPGTHVPGYVLASRRDSPRSRCHASRYFQNLLRPFRGLTSTHECPASTLIGMMYHASSSMT